ncbi:DUF3846 domain-containing protein [Pseudactinotalea sp. Z1748]|uniref:DUF3846 domain-containing protein n=1 Tax=Pseudactinotalea sp. Z1748 TaxID=3413027 RepID=UPI003C7CA112
MSHALRITETGEVTEVSWADGQQLQALQEGVEGLVDLVALTPAIGMWVNEEGLFTHGRNPLATAIAGSLRGAHYQDYYGPAVFTGGTDEQGGTLPLARAEEDRIRAYARVGLGILALKGDV